MKSSVFLLIPILIFILTIHWNIKNNKNSALECHELQEGIYKN